MTARSVLALAAIASSCLSSAAPAFAQAREPVQARIATDDLNLASPAGQRRLEARIASAVARACTSSASGLAGLADAAQCRREMRADAAVQVTALRERSSVQVAGNYR